MSGELFLAALFALAVQGLVIYVAIRLALRDDRTSRARDVLKAKTAAEWKARRDADWKAKHAAETLATEKASYERIAAAKLVAAEAK